jgi:hypothetical protein
MLGVLTPRGGGEEIPLLKKRLLLGRRAACDIALDFPNISGKHCELELIGGYWQIRDLASANGTRVNGEKIESKWLMPGDEIGFAKHFYVISYTPTSTGPRPEDGIDLGVGLLKKAGLMNDLYGQAPTTSGKSSRPAGSPKPAPPKPPEDDDEIDAMKWLTGE